MFLVIWAMSAVLFGGVGGAAKERLPSARLDVMVWKPDEDGAGGAADCRLLPWFSWLRHPAALPDDRPRLGGISRRCSQPARCYLQWRKRPMDRITAALSI